MQVESQQQDWDELSALDPLWAILSSPGRRHGKWTLDDFFASGRNEVAEVLAIASRSGLPTTRDAALDFGCGTGRLTRALGEQFASALGVDISPRMIDTATELNTDVPSCRFEINASGDLANLRDDTFSLVLSLIVLQHIPGRGSKRRYVSELARVLRPGGVLVLQVPALIPARHRLQPRPRLYGVLRRCGVSPEVLYRRLDLHPIRMTALTPANVQAALAAVGARVVDRQDRRSDHGIISVTYFATKDA
jgi:SAM-dependent methyltransferase